MGLSPTKVYVLLDSPPVDVKVYVRDLEVGLGCPVAVDDDSVRLVNADTDEEIACLGDAVDVEVLCKSRGRDRWELRLARVES